MQHITVQKDIRFKTIETPTAWIVVAVLVEHIDGQTVVSEPRIVRVIEKDAPTLCLPTPFLAPEITRLDAIVSPYTSFFTSTEAGILAWCGARPPTL